MAQQVQSDTERIIQALRLYGAQVDGPTDENGELCYLINNYHLNEHEIHFLAENQRLTTWEIYNYVRNRTFMSNGELRR